MEVCAKGKYHMTQGRGRHWSGQPAENTIFIKEWLG